MTLDDCTEGPPTWLGMAFSPYVLRRASAAQLGTDQLEARYGPVLQSEVVAQLLNFSSVSALLRSVDRRSTPLGVASALSRSRVHFSTRQVAAYRAWIAHDLLSREALAPQS